jgi:drug/metabolite transporter (DMT)-like permease
LKNRGELGKRLSRPESGQDQPLTLTAVNAISDLVAPVVLLTVGGMLSNGLITIYNDINNRVRDMTSERLTIYVALVVLGLSIVVIALAVARDDEITGQVALGLVLAGTIIMLLGLGVAVMSLAKSADAVTSAVNRSTKFG